MVHILTLFYSIEVFKMVLAEKERKQERNRKETEKRNRKEKVKTSFKVPTYLHCYIFSKYSVILYSHTKLIMYKISITLTISIFS